MGKKDKIVNIIIKWLKMSILCTNGYKVKDVNITYKWFTQVVKRLKCPYLTQVVKNVNIIHMWLKGKHCQHCTQMLKRLKMYTLYTCG